MLTATVEPQSATFLPELEHEIILTRRVLERLPAASFDWQPHPKSMPLGRLATHTADMMSFLATTMQTQEIDLANELDVYQPATTPADVLQRLADGGEAAKQALAAADDEAFGLVWTMRNGQHVITAQPRREVVRHLISHMVHHRAQLMVYLRLLDVPVPAIYGPSADEA
ncbi:DinB family protein [Hymenobacter negativus]|uniref:DinB family protein n=1 Tax=Hymenobacter negativus TaxID=2795026 RepID=A0ABS3QD43_9BACT|nr:DinB family protein [Hymenobacter negativus]MBO2008635.1 DinB family protein [Hymenobacter negativus]